MHVGIEVEAQLDGGALEPKASPGAWYEIRVRGHGRGGQGFLVNRQKPGVLAASIAIRQRDHEVIGNGHHLVVEEPEQVEVTCPQNPYQSI